MFRNLTFPESKSNLSECGFLFCFVLFLFFSSFLEANLPFFYLGDCQMPSGILEAEKGEELEIESFVTQSFT